MVFTEQNSRAIKGIVAASISSSLRIDDNGPFSDDPNDSRQSFRQLAALKREIASEGIENVQCSTYRWV